MNAHTPATREELYALEVIELRGLLHEVADQLDKWAAESVRGGWSTHQVQAQRDLAFEIRTRVQRP